MIYMIYIYIYIYTICMVVRNEMKDESENS